MDSREKSNLPVVVRLDGHGDGDDAGDDDHQQPEESVEPGQEEVEDVDDALDGGHRWVLAHGRLHGGVVRDPFKPVIVVSHVYLFTTFFVSTFQTVHLFVCFAPQMALPGCFHKDEFFHTIYLFFLPPYAVPGNWTQARELNHIEGP